MKRQCLLLAFVASAVLGMATAQQEQFDPRRYPYYWEGRGTKDPGAWDGEAFRRKPPGACAHVWWFGFKLEPGYYEVHVRARVDEGFEGTFHLVLVDTSGDKERVVDFVSRTKRVSVKNTEYQDLYAGTFYYDGSYPFRLSDYSTKGIYIDCLYLKPVARTQIRDPQLPPLPTYQAPRVLQPPCIDGRLDDWSRVEPVALGHEGDQVRMHGYKGTADCSGRLYMGWDRQNLYVACEVIDDVHFQRCEDERLGQMWEQDSIQLGFDPGHDTKLARFDERDFEYGVALTARGARMFRWYAAGGQLPEGRVDSCPMAVVRDEQAKCTVYEFAIPWHELLMDPLQTRKVGFDIIINDNDGQGRKGWVQWTSGLGETKDPTNWAVVTLIDAPSTAGAHVKVWLVAATEYSTQKTAEVKLHIWSARPYAAARAVLSVRDEGGRVAQSRQVEAAIKAGETGIVFPVKLKDLENGHYTLQVVVRNEDGTELGRAELAFLKADASRLLQQMAAVRRQAQEVRQIVERLRQAGIPYEYVLTSAAVADAFDALVSGDIEAGRLTRAETELSKLQQMLTRAKKRGEDLLRHPEDAKPVPAVDMGAVAPRAGTFYAGSHECLMLGLMGWHYCRGIMPLASEMGFNCVGVVGPYASDILPAPGVVDSGWAAMVDEMLENGRRYNLGIWWHMSPEQMPKWAVDDEPRCGLSETWRSINRKFLGWFCRRARNCPQLLGIVINGEGGHSFTDHPLYIAEFRRRMMAKYGSIERLNEEWGSEYSSFEELTYPTELESRASWYDLCRFNQDMLTEWLAWKTRFIHQQAPDVLTYALPSVLTADDPTDFSDGWDHEAAMSVLDVLGGDGGVNYTGNDPGARYAMSTLGYLWWMELLRSYDQEKALYDWEYHTTIQHQNYPPQYCRAHTIQAMLHGQDAATLWVWEPNHSESRLVEDPLVLESYGQTALDLRRLSHVIASFGRPQSQVAILSAISSMPDAGHHQGYISAYIGSFFLDAPVDFITERQIAAGRLAGYKLLIVPDAVHCWDSTYKGILAFALMGGKVLATEGSLTRDEHDGHRSAAALYALDSVRTIKPRLNADGYAQILDDVYRWAGIRRPLRVRTASGEPVTGVDFRCKRIDGKLHCYLINMNKQPVRVRLIGEREPGTGYDLLAGERIKFPLQLEPLDVRIIRLEQ